MIDEIQDMVLSDRRIKLREIVEATGISQNTVFSFLHEKLGVNKISTRWVPHLLSKDNKRNLVVDYKPILKLFCRNTDEFLHRYITADETWIHYYTENEFGSLLARDSGVTAEFVFRVHSRDKGTVKAVGF